MDDADDDLIRKNSFTMQIIAGALLMGLVVFLGMTAFLVMGKDRPARENGLPIISIVAICQFAISVPLSFALPGMMTGNFLRSIVAGTFKMGAVAGGNQRPVSEIQQLFMVRQTTMIVSRAILEAAGFTGCLAYLVTGHWLGLAVASAVVALMVLSFPTEGRIRAWLEKQKIALEDMRSRGQC